MQCPNCQAAIPDTSFGLITCQSCSKLLSVGFDGSITFAEEPEHFELTESEKTSEPEPFVASEYQVNQYQTSDDAEDATYEDVPQPIQPIANRDNFESEASAQTIEQSRPQIDWTSESEIKKQKDPIKDIADFGNSKISQAADGLYLYTVMVGGIDSEDLRTAVREALKDKRFAWDDEALYRSIKSGKLVLKQISAVKAAVLVNRLKSYPLDIRWTQIDIREAET